MPKTNYTLFNFLDTANQTLEVRCSTFQHKHCWGHRASVILGGKTYTAITEYEGRTWERFEFDTVLQKLARKIGKNFSTKLCDSLLEQITAHAKKESDEADKWANNFAKKWDENVSDDIKARTAKVLNESNIDITSKEQAEGILQVATAFSAMQELFGGK